MARKKPIFGALPTLNLPVKSHDTKPTTTRAARSIVKDVAPEDQNEKCYYSYKELLVRVKALKFSKDWTQEEMNDRLLLKKVSTVILPELQIIIDDSLGVTVSVFGWLLPDDHEIYIETFRSVTNITVSKLIKKIEALLICSGVKPSALSSDIQHHVIPRPVDPLYDDEECFPSKEFWRTQKCSLLCDSVELCPSCSKYEHKQKLADNTKSKKLSEPAHLFAPVSKTAPERIKATLQAQRLRCAELEQQLNEMRCEIRKSSVEVDRELSQDITNIISNSSENITPFMNLFWQEQKKMLANTSTGVRYHPMIIRFCLSSLLLQNHQHAMRKCAEVRFLNYQAKEHCVITGTVFVPKLGFMRISLKN